MVDSNYTCLAVISFDSTLRKDEDHYPQKLFKKCKCITKNLIRHINDNSKDFSSCDYSDDSYKEPLFI